MKKILLSSAAIVAFAGAAAAEVEFGGDATLGYNDDIIDGFYAELGVDLTLTQELNNGWTAGATFSFDVEDYDADNDNILGNDEKFFDISNDFTIYVESDMGGLYFGDYDSAADQLSIGVEGLADGMDDFDDDDNLVLKAKFGSVEAAASASVDDGGDVYNETAAVKGTFGAVDVSLGYVDHGSDNATAVAIATSFGGATIEAGFADNEGDSNYGIEVGYPVGPVALTVWYADGDQARKLGLKAVYEDGPVSVTAKIEDTEGGDTTYNLEGTYDLGNGLLIGAGTVDGEGEYIGAKYDLGGGATFLAAYADGDSDGSTKDIGDAYDGDFELNDGLTLEVSLSF